MSIAFVNAANALNYPRSYINTVAGWVNLLLMSSSGPIKIPVGAWFVKTFALFFFTN